MPIGKAWGTDAACEVASLGVQVHGGMGFSEEPGAAQHYRDARILPIYAGTNGIQALDLFTRKLLRDHGQAMKTLIRELQDGLPPAGAATGPLRPPQRTSLAQWVHATDVLANAGPQTS